MLRRCIVTRIHDIHEKLYADANLYLWNRLRQIDFTNMTIYAKIESNKRDRNITQQLAKMNLDEIFDLTAGVYFYYLYCSPFFY